MQVDNAHFDNEQLFLGTLFFTFLLFLLPTTLVYYAVMAVLYAGVLLLRRTIDLTISAIDLLIDLFVQ